MEILKEKKEEKSLGGSYGNISNFDSLRKAAFDGVTGNVVDPDTIPDNPDPTPDMPNAD